MTAAYETSTAPPMVVDEAVGARAPTVPGTVTGSLLAVGLVTVVIGAWGGIIPYLGPVFGYGATGDRSWTWNLGHGVLGFAPGAVAVLAGLAMMVGAGRVALGLGRPGLALAGLGALLAGAWFVVGPTAWPVLDHGTLYFAGGSPYRQMLDMIGYAFGPGVILAAAGGFALAKSLRHRVATTVAPGLAAAGSLRQSGPRATHLRRVPDAQPAPAPGQPVPVEPGGAGGPAVVGGTSTTVMTTDAAGGLPAGTTASTARAPGTTAPGV